MGVTRSWEPDASSWEPDASSWEPDASSWRTGDTSIESPAPGDQWIPVDPSAYSNPYTEAPVYTSGPQSAPVVVPSIDDPPAPPGRPFPPPVTQDGPVAHTVPVTQPRDPQLVDSSEPEPGELKIKERRSWKTWQLLAAAGAAAVVGMWINGNVGSASGSGSTGSGSGGRGGYALPPPSGSSGTTTLGASSGAAAPASSTTTTVAPRASAGKGGASKGTTTTTSPQSSTTTLVGGANTDSSTPSAVAAGPATVLIPRTQQTGNWTSPTFTIAAGTWSIGWAFRCVPVPATPPAFEIFVVNAGGSPGSTPAVSSPAASGQSVTSQTGTGGQQLIVQAGPACQWAVKVTGFSG